MAVGLRLAALAGAVVAVRCAEPPSYPVRIFVPAGSPSVASADLFVLRSCEEVDSPGNTPTSALRSVHIEAESGTRSPTLGLLSKGSYALYGVARDEDCVLFAAGCVSFAVPWAPGAVELSLESVAPRGCEANETCRRGRCARAESDGGPSDASTDASGPDGGYPKCGSEIPCASSFRDDFDDGAAGPGWEAAWVDGCEVGMAEGALMLAPPFDGTSIGPCAYHARGDAGVFDLRGDSITVEVPRASHGAMTYLGTEIPDQGQSEEDSQFLVLFVTREGELHFIVVPLDAPYDFRTLGGIPYSAEEHRWWRLREQAGMVYWDTSANGQSWVNQASTRLEVPEAALTHLTVTLGVESQDPLTEFDPATFDNYNLPP